MGIRNAGTIIKEARLRAGLKQDQMAFGICSLVSLCNIENGRLGVSSATFQALMKRAGAPSAAFPLFKNRKDFDAYILLKNVRLYTDKNCLSLACDELMKLKDCNYGDNKLYYQEALYLYARIKYLAADADYATLHDILKKALAITHPDFSLDSFEDDFLSSVDCEILFLRAWLYINTGKPDNVKKICATISRTLENSLNDDDYTAYIRMLLHFTYAKLFFSLKEYADAKEYIDTAKRLAEEYYIETDRVEILILQAVCDYCVDSSTLSNDLLYMMSLASYLGCGFLSTLKEELRKINIPEQFLDVDIPEPFSVPQFSYDTEVDSLSDGVIDYDDETALTIGSVIGILRQEQHLPMNVLCEGLCSISKLSKIENNKQAPNVYLTEALLNRLGYSERSFMFYGNSSESDYWRKKYYLISKDRKGELSSKEVTDNLDEWLLSEEPAIRQLCLTYKNTSNYTYYEREKALLEGINISIPDFSISTLSQKRLSWIEITLLNGLCMNYIKSQNFKDAEALNNALCDYARNPFITPGFKIHALFLSFRLRFKYLYNVGSFDLIVKELASLKDELMLKSTGSAADFFFYSSQALGELKQYDEMIKHTRIAAGFFTAMGLTKRKKYLLSEIKRQFDIDV